MLTYHEATKIDRSNPKVVLDEYLRAALVQKDGVLVELHSCEEPTRLGPIVALRKEMDQREHDFGVNVLVTWGAIAVAEADSEATATTALTISGRKDGAVTSKRTETWRFTLVDEGGWRVCRADRLEQPAPSASSSP
ncbi:hypothetical protein ACFQY4_01425 [Catellatospora bangladeshensis]|uniref:Uncharacterized protein n=1 Tax=Catellatospora bangladeshensis TaxID=310355 RepID=A0A8J3NIY6_9ACTN|nr:hypothetical protein Cba03nite_27220 [Catellatospora bangladeshensis]